MVSRFFICMLLFSLLNLAWADPLNLAWADPLNLAWTSRSNSANASTPLTQSEYDQLIVYTLSGHNLIYFDCSKAGFPLTYMALSEDAVRGYCQKKTVLDADTIHSITRILSGGRVDVGKDLLAFDGSYPQYFFDFYLDDGEQVSFIVWNDHVGKVRVKNHSKVSHAYLRFDTGILDQLHALAH